VHWNWIRSLKFDDTNMQTVLAEYVLALEQELERVQRFNLRIEEESRHPDIAPAVARLRTLRGVDTITAMTLISELVDMNRFSNPRELMAFAGLVPSEHSSGGRQCRGHITKTGNAHVRRVLVESAWHYRHSPTGAGPTIRNRQGEKFPCRRRGGGQGTGRVRLGDREKPLIARRTPDFDLLQRAVG
jgi:transposase